MQKVRRIPRKFMLFAAGTAALSVALLVAPTPARAGKLFTATINGPATVLNGYTCTWTATTDITSPDYEWTTWDGSAHVVIGTNASLSYAYDRLNGAHQQLNLKVSNANGDEAEDWNLIGVYASGSPDCP